jgi:hypothetical protein
VAGARPNHQPIGVSLPNHQVGTRTLTHGGALFSLKVRTTHPFNKPFKKISGHQMKRFGFDYHKHECARRMRIRQEIT